MYMRYNVSKIKGNKRYKNPHYIPHIHTPPITKISYTSPPPMSMTTLISTLLSLFVTSDKGQVHQVDISSSLGELAPSSLAASSLPEPSSLSSSNVDGEGEEAAVKPPMAICRRVI